MFKYNNLIAQYINSCGLCLHQDALNDESNYSIKHNVSKGNSLHGVALSYSVMLLEEHFELPYLILSVSFL